MHIARLILPLLMFASSALAGPSAKPADAFWVADKVHTIHVRVTAERWQMMQPTRGRGQSRVSASQMPRPAAQPSTRPVLTTAPSTQPAVRQEGERLDPNAFGMQFAYVMADFECDGTALKDIGFRLRGNSSYRWGASDYKYPYKVDFNRFVDGQKFLGLTGFFLNNNAYDPSFLRETLAYETFRALGAPAPRTTFALVYLTIDGKLSREYLGLYTLIEDIDTKDFLKDRFGSSKGLLLKPWAIRGLPYLGETWEAYQSRYTPRTDPTSKTARRTIDFIKLVNYADDATFEREIETYLDVDKFLRVLAGDVILSNLDTFLYTGHNFYLYLNAKDDRFYFMPWDMNLSFANFTSAASIEQHIHLSIMRPHVGEMKLIDRLLAMPNYRAAYRRIIQGAVEDFYSAERFGTRYEQLQGVLAQAEAAADAAWKARHTPPAATQPVKIPPRPPTRVGGWQGGSAIALQTFVARRVESLRAQLAGETDGFVPGSLRAPSPPAGGLRAHAAYGNLPQIVLAVMRSMDPNCDSRLTREEFMAAARELLTSADAARQNAVDAAGLERAVTRLLQRVPQQRRPERGGRRDGQRGAEPAAMWADAVFAAMGRPRRLAAPDALRAADAAFTRHDTDKSGKLDPEELLAALDALAAANPPAPPTTRPAGPRIRR